MEAKRRQATATPPAQIPESKPDQVAGKPVLVRRHSFSCGVYIFHSARPKPQLSESLPNFSLIEFPEPTGSQNRAIMRGSEQGDQPQIPSRDGSD